MRDGGTGPVGSPAAPAWMTIPGDPTAVAALAETLLGFAQLLADGARDLGRVEVDWSGRAADAFQAEFELHPLRWKAAAAAFDAAGTALRGYAAALTAAQSAASRAASLYGQGLAQQAVADPVGAALAAGGGPAAELLAAGNGWCEQAVVAFTRARHAAQEAGNEAARALTSAVECAPGAPSWYESVYDAGSEAGVWLWDHLLGPVLAPTVNAIADVGAAAVHHPEDAVQVVGGVGLVGLGGLGLGGSGILDATILAAPAGAVVGVASLGLVGAGGTLAAQGASRWGRHALDEDAHVMQATWAETTRNGHSAGFKVTGADGQVRFGGAVHSRPMLPEEKALPFPDSMFAAHTESRIARWWQFEKGDLIEIDGTEPPCGRCQRVMSDLAKRMQGKVVYRAYGEAWVWGGQD